MNDTQNRNVASFRDILEIQKKQKRGSAVITVITVLLFLAAALFYIKTSHPNFAKKAIAYFKDFTAGQKSLKTVSDAIYDEVTPENQSGESGEILKTAETLSFDYIPGGDGISFLSSSPLNIHTLPVLNATLTSDFGGRTDPVTGKQDATHGGIDLAAAKNSDIYAFSSGRVVSTGYNDIYGNCITLDHGNGVNSFYGHLSKITVETGDNVKTGDTVGVIGSTGKSTGTHLHFELHIDGKKVDPTPYLYEKI